jgi:deazaflavin-dependent oxidoreductase (nitroreductase family)
MSPFLRRMFWFLNKYFMVPIFRLGLGPLMVNPFSGYIMVLKTVGRKSGVIRYAPVNYAIRHGSVYCISGGGRSSDWYKNAMAHPELEVLLPAGAVFGTVAEVTDPVERCILLRSILKNAGFAGFLEGFNPYAISDEQLVLKCESLPVLRIRPAGVANGAFDPGGWSWTFWLAVGIAFTVALVATLLR